VVLRALSIAFPFLQVRDDWMDRIEELEDAMHLTFEERGDLIVEAALGRRRAQGAKSRSRRSMKKPRR
jgi:hypothetical protein